MTDPDMKNLETFLAQAAKDTRVPTPDLMARVLADAKALQPQASQPATRVGDDVGTRSRWSVFWGAIGGWPALGGLVTAGVAGLWLGIAPPASIETLAADVLGTTMTLDLMGSYDLQEVFDG